MSEIPSPVGVGEATVVKSGGQGVDSENKLEQFDSKYARLARPASRVTTVVQYGVSQSDWADCRGDSSVFAIGCDF